MISLAPRFNAPLNPLRGGGGDPYWQYVRLLLKGNGSNGATAFTDSSKFANTVVRGGSATISTAQSKWGGSSIYFNSATSDFLKVSTNVTLGTSPFVVEAWIYLVSYTSGVFLDTRTTNSDTTNPLVYWQPTTNNYDYFRGGSHRLVSASNVPALATWVHIAAGRDATGRIRLWVNGADVVSGTNANENAINYNGTILRIGSYVLENSNFLNAYLNDYRLTIGSDRGYNSATIPVPTAPFPTF